MKNVLQELREKLAKLHAESKAIEAQVDQEGRDFTAEERAKLDAIEAEFNATQDSIRRREAAEAREAALAIPQPTVAGTSQAPGEAPTPAGALATGRPTFTPAPQPGQWSGTRVTGGMPVSATYGNHGFGRGLAEFLTAVKLASFGRTDQRLLNAVTTYGGEGIGSDGGFGVPPDFSTTITSLVVGEGSLVSRFNPILTQSNQLVLPTDETTPYGTSGIYGEWLGEAGTLTPRKPSIKQVTVVLQKVGALVHLSDELTRDAPAIQSHVTRKVAQAIAGKVNEALMTGDGVAKPLGLLNAPGIVTQAKSGASLAAVDLAGMLSRMVPESVNSSFWIVHTSFLPKVWTLTLGQMPIWVNDLRMSPYGNILGRPVIVSEYCQDYNTAGDVFLFSPDGYACAVASMGVETAASIHFAFDQGLNSFRAIMRVGGTPLASTTIARKNGSTTLSHILNLQARS
jgi:HK97 family phage major capsid protein